MSAERIKVLRKQFMYGERSVRSTGILVPGHASTCFLRGRLDITQLGLLCVEPKDPVRGEDAFAYRAAHTWREIPLDRDGFISFLGEVLDVLERPNPPPPSPRCAWCRYAEVIPALEEGRASAPAAR